MNKLGKNILLASFVSILFATAFIGNTSADEALFGRTSLTDTLPKRKWEAVQMYSGKYGDFHNRYANSLYQTGIQYGMTDRLQEAVYLNYRHVYANRNERNGTTGGANVPENASTSKPFNHLLFDSVSSESIYRVSSPYLNPVGIALYLKPTFGRDTIAIAPKLILQKNFLEDRLVWGFNLNWVLAWDRETGGAILPGSGRTKRRWRRHADLEASTGIIYRFAPRWWAGVELFHDMSMESFNPADIGNLAFFAGPTIHYSSQRFWITTNVLFQLPIGVPISRESKNETEGDSGKIGRILGDQHQKIEAQLKMGYQF